jgi:hypothetical protein
MKSLFTSLSVVAVLMLSACSSCPLGNKVTASGKIEHIVLVWLKRPGNAEDLATLVSTAKKFQAEITEIQHLSVGSAVASDRDIVDDSFDVGFVMRFDDKATLTAYENHPVHKEAVKKTLLPMAKKVLVYDIGCK